MVYLVLNAKYLSPIQMFYLTPIYVERKVEKNIEKLILKDSPFSVKTNIL